MTKDYTPIPCAVYNRYEVAILSRTSLRIMWHGARGIDRVETLTPTDLRTRSGAEFMIARNRLGHRRVLRLDRIRTAEPIA